MSSRRTIGSFMLGASALAIALTGCVGSSGESAGADQELIIGTTSDVATFDPAQSNVGGLLQYLFPVYDTLIRLDESGELVPMLATAWEYVDAGNTQFELTLRDDVSFSDGTPMTADAVARSLQRFKEGNGPRASALAAVQSIEAPDESTVRLTLSAPDPALAYNLALVAGMVTNPVVTPDDLASVPAGTGPYVLDTEATRRGDVYVLTRNENYYNPEAFPFAEVSLRVLTDPTARLNAVKTGQVDATVGVSSQRAEAEASGLDVVSALGGWQGLFLADRSGATTPALSSVQVRQAVNYAIDGDALLESVAFGNGSPTTQVFSPSSVAYDEDLDETYPFDPDRARELLAEAGYADGFTLRMPSLDSLSPEAYPIIEQQLADVGITVEYTPVTAAGGLAPFVSGEYPAYMFLWGSSEPWIDATQLLSASGTFNPFRVEDPKVTALLSRIALATGDEQDALYRELSAYVVDQAWFDPWYVNDSLMFVGDKVTVAGQPQMIMPPIYNYRPAEQ